MSPVNNVQDGVGQMCIPRFSRMSFTCGRFVEVTDKHISKIKINSAQKKHKKPVYEHTKTIIRVMLAR